MINAAIGTGVVIGATLTLLSEYVVWKLGLQRASHEQSVRNMPSISATFLDTLIASIVCPLTLDVIFAIKWTISCEFLFVFSITTVSLILYLSTLIVTYKMSAVFYPSPKSLNENNFGHLWTNGSALSFCLSVVANIVTSLITLMLCLRPFFEVQYLDAEACWISSVRKNNYFVFLPLLILQVTHIICYGCLRQFYYKINLVKLHLTSSSSNGDSIVLQNDDNIISTVAYSAMAVFCLFMANILRFSYSICSCHLYVVMASGVSNICWLIVIKLPVTGLLYWRVSGCWRTCGQSRKSKNEFCVL